MSRAVGGFVHSGPTTWTIQRKAMSHNDIEVRRALSALDAALAYFRSTADSIDVVKKAAEDQLIDAQRSLHNARVNEAIRHIQHVEAGCNATMSCHMKHRPTKDLRADLERLQKLSF